MSTPEVNTPKKEVKANPSSKDKNFANFSMKFDLSDENQKKLYEKLNQCRNYLSSGDAKKKTIPKRGKDIAKADEVFFLALEFFDMKKLVPALKLRLDNDKEKRAEIVHELWNKSNNQTTSFFGFLTEQYNSLTETEIDELLSSSISSSSKKTQDDPGLNTVQ